MELNLATKRMKRERGKIKLLSFLARGGDKTALCFFREVHRVKAYTREEIYILNYFYRKRGTEKGRKKIDVSREDKVILLPNCNGSKHLAKLNWIRELESPYFEAGLNYCDLPLKLKPSVKGSFTWVLKLDPEEGFIPLFNSSHWREILTERSKTGGQNARL